MKVVVFVYGAFVVVHVFWMGHDPREMLHKELSTHIDAAIKLNEPLVLRDSLCNNPPIVKAAQNNFTDLVERLTKHGVDITTQRGMGISPLHFATQHNNRKLVQFLLRHKAKTECVTPSPMGYTPLHIAVEEGHVSIAVDLLCAGADPNAQTAAGERPLDVVVKVSADDADKRTDVMRKNAIYWLLYYGAQPDLLNYVIKLRGMKKLKSRFFVPSTKMIVLQCDDLQNCAR